MSSIDQPDGVVTYTLALPMSGLPNRIYEYNRKPDKAGVALAHNPSNSTVVQLVENKKGTSEDVIQVQNGDPNTPVYVGIEIKASDGSTPLYPYAILIRQKGDAGRGNEDATFPNVYIVNGGTRLVLEDNVTGAANYDFDVLFSAQSGSSGDMGWLDPKLENLE